jgi:predicted NBD/HSP70 family sugar kinase
VPNRARSDDKRSKILALIGERGEVSRGDLAAEFGLDKKTVSSIVDSLASEDLLAQAGFRDSLGGRPQELLRLNGMHSSFVGIDLGGTHIIGVRVDLAGRLVDRVFFEIRPGLPVDLILDQMRTICSRLIAAPQQAGPVRSIGICVPGFVNPDTGTSIVAENIPGWQDVRLREIFASDCSLPVVVEDSSRAYALAEKWQGDARGTPDFVLADLGYGIGMGVVVGGSLLRGAGNKAGEIGHTIVAPGGPACTCGNSGCLETVASGRAIARQAAEGIAAGKSELLSGLTHGRADSATARDVAVAASMGDAFSTDLLRAAGTLAGMAIANAVNILNPSLLILGGGLMGTTRIMEESIAGALRAHCMRGIYEELEMRVSRQGIDGSARGAAILASAEVFGRV